MKGKTGKGFRERIKRLEGFGALAVKGGLCFLAAAALILGRTEAGYGADSSVIESLTVTFKTTYGEPGEIPDPEITINGSGCSLGDIQFRTDYDKWKPGKKVRVEITVNAEEGKVFPVSLNRSKCKVSGADFVSAKALEDDVLQVRVDYTPVTVLEDTTEAGWSKNSRMQALWKKVDYAPGYSLVLYGDGKVIKRMTVQSNTVNLAEFMKDEDLTVFYYEVKAIPVTSSEKKYLKEGEFVTSTDQEFDADDWAEPSSSGSSGNGPGGSGASGNSSGGPGASGSTSGGPGAGGMGAGDGGAIKGNNYIMPDGSMARDTWKKISGCWYYFDQNGNMCRGWQNIRGFWYFMNAEGIMQTGWINPSGDTWFYLTANGEMCTGWIQPVPGSWYYLDSSGYMQRGWQLINGKWYYLNQDGRMKTGWLQDGGKRYYLNSDGSMAVNTSVDGWTIGADGAAYQ